MKNTTQIMDEADALLLLPEKRSRCEHKEGLIRQSGREVPARPAFEAGAVLGESDALDLHELRLDSILKSAAGTLKDPLSADAIAANSAKAEREIVAAESAIRSAGGDVPNRPYLSDAHSAQERWLILDTHARKLMFQCKEACVEVHGTNLTETERVLAFKGKSAQRAQQGAVSGDTAKVFARFGVSSYEELAAKRKPELAQKQRDRALYGRR